MASIIDPSIEEIGNPQAALEQATAAINAEKSGSKATGNTATTIPDKFKGKSLEEIVAAYQNLEALHGRTASELGQTRQSVDQLLLQKRENDLRANGGTARQAQESEPELTAADLLENPKQALNNYLEHRESATTKDLRQRLAQQEQMMAQQSFVGKHPDWQEQTNDPEFIEWAKQTEFRRGLAVRAAREDLPAADALLSEYKAYKPLLSRTNAEGTTLDAARRVGLERSATSGEETRSTGKIMRRIDAQALRISDPDKYDSPAFQNELLKAISEGRYK